MTGLPKKFAKLGFKAGWKAYKKLKRKSKSIKSNRSKTMAKKRRKRYVRRRRSPSRSSKKGSSTGFARVFMTQMVPAGVYGYGREWASAWLANLTSRIPLGSIADEAGMLIASYFLKKKTKGIISQIGQAGIYIESARLGASFGTGSAVFSNGSISRIPVM